MQGALNALRAGRIRALGDSGAKAGKALWSGAEAPLVSQLARNAPQRRVSDMCSGQENLDVPK